jgi:hypothetical protein
VFVPPAKKSTAKKSTAKKSTAKKPPAKKPPAKKPPAKKRAARPVPDTPNPFAPHNWPFNRGQSVYYLASNDGRVTVRVGTVTAYHPFLPMPMVAVYQSAHQVSGTLMVRLADVSDLTVDGKAKLEAVARDRQLANAAEYERLAAQLRADVLLSVSHGKRS